MASSGRGGNLAGGEGSTSGERDLPCNTVPHFLHFTARSAHSAGILITFWQPGQVARTVADIVYRLMTELFSLDVSYRAKFPFYTQ